MVFCFGTGFASNSEENELDEVVGGIAVVTEIGLWVEKNDAIWMSVTCKNGARTQSWLRLLPRGCKCCVEGTLGRLRCVSSLGLATTSFDFRLPTRVVDDFSAGSFAAGWRSLVRGSDGVEIALGSSLGADFGDVRTFDDECCR